MQKITPHLWFDDKAEEAAQFYVSVFKDSKIMNSSRYDETVAQVAGRPAGSVMTVEFELNGQRFLALNGGPLFKFTEAISFMVSCEDQAEVDYFWEKLSAVPESEQCGWLKDKYGLSWQIVPKVLEELIADSDREKANKVMQAMLKMKKIEVDELLKAAAE